MWISDKAEKERIQAFMGLFVNDKAIRIAMESIGELKDAVTDLKRKNRSLELEFTELYDKVSHQMSRMSKRYAARTKAEENSEEEPPNQEHVIGSDYVSQSILARRTRGRLG